MKDLIATATFNDSNNDITIHKFTFNQQKNIIKLYNDNDNKIIAMQYIQLLPNCYNLNENDILRWMIKAKTGKSISVEFENEVMLACKKLDSFLNNNKKTYSYTTIRECAKKVFDREYWDVNSKSFIKKWHYDKRTYKLQFTNKWVTGMLKRNNCCSSLSMSSNSISLSSSSSELSSISLPSLSLPLQSSQSSSLSSSSSLVILSNILKSLQPSNVSTIINGISDKHLSSHDHLITTKHYQPNHYHTISTFNNTNDDFDTVMESSPEFFGDLSSVSSSSMYEFQDCIEFDSL